jgi:hypothetical protein
VFYIINKYNIFLIKKNWYIYKKKIMNDTLKFLQEAHGLHGLAIGLAYYNFVDKNPTTASVIGGLSGLYMMRYGHNLPNAVENTKPKTQHDLERKLDYKNRQHTLSNMLRFQ